MDGDGGDDLSGIPPELMNMEFELEDADLGGC